MKDTGSLHLKVQELCDCYATTDPLKEMSAIKNDDDREEAALKWLALAALHGVNSNAKKISVFLSDEGTVTVSAEYREAVLPSPGPEIGQSIFDALGRITHIDIEEGKGKTPLALGIRDSSLELEVKMKAKSGGKKISIRFPE
ncbi:hypothetical protein DENIS_2617 [Desulfonema ishimotonii]|uniref:Uncharacterized protein n=1 Tax=Desulfonema ishimotonii TaxID=45657 RepID=A0A401FXG9_9BACT|nr:hypothetical protein [Desulfonema ishimotonii]GBC61655.1 hypothetical protein DENIS_2617 [Desulfonema ishimotonii]